MRVMMARMANLTQADRLFAGWVLAMVIVGAARATTTVYMDGKCDETIYAGSSGGLLDSQIGLFYDNDVDCTVTFEADFDRQILITFDRVDIEGESSWLSCDGDYLEIFDGTSTLASSLDVICGTYADDVVSTSNTITLQFKTDSSSTGRGFLIAYTSFKSSFLTLCGYNEFECDNGRCIDESLKGNLYDNCGDNSDESGFFDDLDIEDTINKAIGLSIGIIIAIIVGCIAAAVLVCVCVGCLCYHCFCKSRPRQQTSYQVVSQTPQQQQPAMAMQPTSQPSQPAPYGQPAACPPGQPVYPPGQPAYPPGQPAAYPPGQPAAYPPGQPAAYPPGQPAPYGDIKA